MCDSLIIIVLCLAFSANIAALQTVRAAVTCTRTDEVAICTQTVSLCVFELHNQALIRFIQHVICFFYRIYTHRANNTHPIKVYIYLNSLFAYVYMNQSTPRNPLKIYSAKSLNQLVILTEINLFGVYGK